MKLLSFIVLLCPFLTGSDLASGGNRVTPTFYSKNPYSRFLSNQERRIHNPEVESSSLSLATFKAL